MLLKRSQPSTSPPGYRAAQDNSVTWPRRFWIRATLGGSDSGYTRTMYLLLATVLRPNFCTADAEEERIMESSDWAELLEDVLLIIMERLDIRPIRSAMIASWRRLSWPRRRFLSHHRRSSSRVCSTPVRPTPRTTPSSIAP